MLEASRAGAVTSPHNLAKTPEGASHHRGRCLDVHGHILEELDWLLRRNEDISAAEHHELRTLEVDSKPTKRLRHRNRSDCDTCCTHAMLFRSEALEAHPPHLLDAAGVHVGIVLKESTVWQAVRSNHPNVPPP